MRIPDPKANTTTEAYLAYKAGYLEESELKPSLYEPYLHFDAWLAYWAGLTSDYPVTISKKNLFDANTGYTNVSSSSTEITIKSGAIDLKATGTTGAQYVRYIKNGFDEALTYTFSCKAKKVVSGEGSGSSIRYVLYGSNTPDDASTWVLLTAESRQTPTQGEEYSLSSTVTGYTAYRWFIYNNTSSPVTVGEETIYYDIQFELGSSSTEYDPYDTPEMLTDEEALVAYLSGVTDTYPEDIKDPYDVRIVGYLKYLVSARWGRPEYPVNNEEFYLSTMKPPVVPSGDTPATNIELDGTAEAPFIDLKVFGDTEQKTLSGKNLLNVSGDTTAGVTGKINADGSYTISGTATKTDGVSVFRYIGTLPAGTYTFSISRALPKVINFSLATGVAFRIAAGRTSATLTTTQEYTNTGDVFFGVEKGDTYNETFKMQLVAGDTPDFDFEPYCGGTASPNPDYPQNVNTVTGRQMVAVTGGDGESAEYEINLGTNLAPVVPGIQLVGGSLGETGYGSVELTKRGEQNSRFFECQMSLAAGETYTLSFDFVNNSSFNADMYIQIRDVADSRSLLALGSSYFRPGITHMERTFVLEKQSGYLAMVSYNNAIFKVSNIQIEKGENKSAFAPYFEPIELCKIDTFQDYIYKGDDGWYLHKGINKRIVKGDSGTVSNVSTNRFNIDNAFDDYDKVFQNITYAVADSYIVLGQTSSNGEFNTLAAEYDYCMNFTRSETSYTMRFKNTSVSTSGDFIAELNNNPVTVYYALDIPTDTLITNSALVAQLDALVEGGSYEGKTYIKVTAADPNRPALLKVEAAKYA